MQKANLLANNFETVFQPYSPEIPEAEDQQIFNALTSAGLLYTPVRPFKITEVRNNIHKQCPAKSHVYNLITSKVLQELPKTGIRAITQLYNGILRTGR
jgi:hypothetical protein